MFVRTSVTLVDPMSKFWVKVSQIGISQQPFIRKHSYFGLGFLGGSAYVPLILVPGSMPQGGAGSQNLGHPKKYYSAFSFMLTPS